MTIHELKIMEPYYDAVASGDKMFEIRYNDRGYQKGDKVILKCWDNVYGKVLSKPDLTFRISYVCNYNQKDGWCVFGLADNGVEDANKPMHDNTADVTCGKCIHYKADRLYCALKNEYRMGSGCGAFDEA